MKIKKTHQVMTSKLKHKSKQLLSKYLTRKSLMKVADVVTRKKLRKHPNPLLLHKCLATKTSSQLEWTLWWCKEHHQHHRETWLQRRSSCTSSRSSTCSSKQSSSTSNCCSIRQWCNLRLVMEPQVKCPRLCQEYQECHRCSRACNQECRWWCRRRGSNQTILHSLHLTENQHQRRDEEAESSHSPRLVTIWHFNC